MVRPERLNSGSRPDAVSTEQWAHETSPLGPRGGPNRQRRAPALPAEVGGQESSRSRCARPTAAAEPTKRSKVNSEGRSYSRAARSREASAHADSRPDEPSVAGYNKEV
jgi:hypothetical protein